MASDGDRELPKGVSRKQIQSIDTIRSYLLERSDEADCTVSEYLDSEVIPDDWDGIEHLIESDEVVYVKVTPSVDEKVDSMAGPRVTKGQVLAYYTLIDAIERGDLRVAERVVEYLPQVLWEVEEP